MTTPPTLARLRELREKHREFGPATAALLDFAIAQAEATEKHRDLFPFTSAGFIGGVYVEAKPECYTALSKAFSELTRKLADEKAKKDDALNNLDRYKTSVDNSLALLRNERDYWRTITKNKQVALDNLTRERDDALAKLVEAQKTVSFPRWADHPEHQAVVKERDDALAALARERERKDGSFYAGGSAEHWYGLYTKVLNKFGNLKNQMRATLEANKDVVG